MVGMDYKVAHTKRWQTALGTDLDRIHPHTVF
jgi:hypothetical protein